MSVLWLSSAHPCAAQLATAPSRRRRRSFGETPASPPLCREARSAIAATRATARIARSTQTQVGVSSSDSELEDVVVAGRMICRVVVCSTVAVVMIVVGSVAVSVVVCGRRRVSSLDVPGDRGREQEPGAEARREADVAQRLPHTATLRGERGPSIIRTG